MSVLIGPKIAVMDGAAEGDAYFPDGNVFLRMMQALIQGNVLDVLVNDPPDAPSNGDTYIVGSGTGAWAGHDHTVAYWTTDNVGSSPAWDFYVPQLGWKMNSNSDGNDYIFNGSTWVQFSLTAGQGIDIVASVINGCPTMDNQGRLPVQLTNRKTIGGIATLSSGTVTVTLTGNAVVTKPDSYIVVAIVTVANGTLGFLNMRSLNDDSFVINSLLSDGTLNTGDNSHIQWILLPVFGTRT